METINLVILSRDVDYSLALGEALSVGKNSFIVRICKSEEEISEIAEFDLLLMDLDGKFADGKFAGDKRVIKLTGSRSDADMNIESMSFALYKYARVQELSAGMLLYYSMLTGKKNVALPDAKSKIIALCSGKGGVGKTTVAFGVGQALRRHFSKSVLYLSMEEIESTLLYIKGREEGPSICEYLYYLLKPGGNKPDAEAFTIHDKYGVCAFMPDKSANRLRELDAAELAAFLSEISTNGAWDYILADMGECFGKEAKWIFDACHKAAVIMPPEGKADERERRFLNCLRFAMGNGHEEKLVFVRNKAFEREEPDESGTVYVDFDSDSINATGETVEISIDQDFGSGIRELVKKIM
ncbi:MAG: hypothetical protein FWG42_06895 [Clostridiales bacterium]|nr:hypothetical protein [Clostridiales bacterium]